MSRYLIDTRCDQAGDEALHDLPFTLERNVLCVVCPGCAFTFDRIHEDDGHRGQYTCPECNTIGRLMDNADDRSACCGALARKSGPTWYCTECDRIVDNADYD